MGLDKNDEVIGYKFVNLGKVMDAIKKALTLKKLMKRISVLTADLLMLLSILTRANNSATHVDIGSGNNRKTTSLNKNSKFPSN